MLQEALPQIYYIPEVDLTDFIYKLHMLCGDFLGDVDQKLHLDQYPSSFLKLFL